MAESTNRKESAVFARVSIYENVDLNLADRVKGWMESSDLDLFGDLPGYRGSMTLVDRDNARLVGVGFYATAGDAIDAEALLNAMPASAFAGAPEEIRPALEWQPESVGLYEVVEHEIRHHA
jgi:hypothetical protein